jgi:hypothetical protein
MEFTTCQLARAKLGFWCSATIFFHLEVASLWLALLKSFISSSIPSTYHQVILEYVQGNTIMGSQFVPFS